ncbi:bark storage protein A-like isoform X2 [Macadamia integrifolia]|uniref:bark storage protein A-like isoform X2 n=1 Tax=Macadamia integrifolia TaxID=60698 RepID=UPI001C4E968E|nr:bark storage protein A-like isoform X2 [Macadamia integrifolia]
MQMNAAITTQIMCTLFSIKGIDHFGLAGNTDKDQNLGDIVIPQSWAHTGLWNWKRYGDRPEDKLSLEDDGEFTREYGYLNFGDYTNKTKDDDSADNFLNNIWYQAEENFNCEQDHASMSTIFWIPVAEALFEFAKELEKMDLEECIDESTCLSETPQVVRVRRGSSANVHLDNAAYKDFLHSKFQVSIVDMESAAMALISYQEKIPFISFRALYEFAGEKSKQSNDQEKTFAPIHVKNLIHILSRFVKYVHKELPDDPTISSM